MILADLRRNLFIAAFKIYLTLALNLIFLADFKEIRFYI